MINVPLSVFFLCLNVFLVALFQIYHLNRSFLLLFTALFFAVAFCRYLAITWSIDVREGESHRHCHEWFLSCILIAALSLHCYSVETTHDLNQGLFLFKS